MITGRNQACPCGSGKRFKDCHGSLGSAGPGSADLIEAGRHLGTGDLARAESACRRVLDLMPDHPEALRLLARCYLERHEIETVLPLLLRAIKSPELATSSRSAQEATWTALRDALTQALSGIDVPTAAAKRAEYRSWRDAPSSSEHSDDEPLVTVVLVCEGTFTQARATLESVYRQTYGNIELVVVSTAAEGEEAAMFANLLRACPFPYRRLVLPQVDEAALINAGVREANGAFINVLQVPHLFAEARIEVLVEQVVRLGAERGFTDVEFDADTRPLSDPLVHRMQTQYAAIADAETAGYSLIHQFCVAVAIGNLFFGRTLFERVAGFRELRLTCAWDFCLRAVFFAEPIHVRQKLYRHNISSRPNCRRLHMPSSGPRNSRSSPSSTRLHAARIQYPRTALRHASDTGVLRCLRRRWLWGIYWLSPSSASKPLPRRFCVGACRTIEPSAIQGSISSALPLARWVSAKAARTRQGLCQRRYSVRRAGPGPAPR